MPQIARSEANDGDTAQPSRTRHGPRSEITKDRARAWRPNLPPPEATCRRRKSARAGRADQRLWRWSCRLIRLVALDGHGQRPLRRTNKLYDFDNQRITGIFAGNPVNAGTKLSLTEKQSLIRRARALNVGLRGTAPPHTNNIEADQISQRAVRHAKRNNVGTHAAQADNHRALTDADKLTECVAAKNRVVGKNDMVSDLAIMPDMRTHHEKTAVTNFRNATIIFSARAHGYVFADVAIGTHNQTRRPSSVAERLRRRSKRCKRINDCPRSDHGMTSQIDVSNQAAPVSNTYVCANRAIRTDQDVFSDRGPGFDPRRGIDHMRAHASDSMAPTWASATT